MVGVIVGFGDEALLKPVAGLQLYTSPPPVELDALPILVDVPKQIVLSIPASTAEIVGVMVKGPLIWLQPSALVTVK